MEFVRCEQQQNELLTRKRSRLSGAHLAATPCGTRWALPESASLASSRPCRRPRGSEPTPGKCALIQTAPRLPPAYSPILPQQEPGSTMQKPAGQRLRESSLEWANHERCWIAISTAFSTAYRRSAGEQHAAATMPDRAAIPVSHNSQLASDLLHGETTTWRMSPLRSCGHLP